ncbi:MAG: sigma-54 dependent transcriptional regulator [Thermodesulfobacteriota bacterium]
METILIVDDEKNYTRILSAVLQEEGYETLTASSGREALDLLHSADVNLVITDMKMPGMDGIELLESIKVDHPDLPIIVMTAFGTIEKAVEAMQKGAFTYIQKPFDNDRLIVFVQKALEGYRVIQENRQLREEVQSKFRFGNLIGKSRRMQELFALIEKVAFSSATVLIEGESGTGKELVAKSIHYNSPRRNKPFIAVNCSALSESLLESELFGHEKGAFTGASTLKKGRFELADTGTLFLDEIGELSLNLQVKLLRVLQERTFERVGGSAPIPVDIRIIAATNRNLKTETHKGKFREDLFFRLNVIHLTLPPLRERTEDIRLLTEHFIAKFSNERRPDTPPVTSVDPEVERLFLRYAWPGNVRELENIIERAMILCPGERIRMEDLPSDFAGGTDRVEKELEPSGELSLYDHLAEYEKRLIERALQQTGYVQSKAADLLGIGKSNLNQKIKRFGIRILDGPGIKV